jgi:hypothetical protein
LGKFQLYEKVVRFREKPPGRYKGGKAKKSTIAMRRSSRELEALSLEPEPRLYRTGHRAKLTQDSPRYVPADRKITIIGA